MRNIYCWLFAIFFTTLKNETLVPLEGDIENGVAVGGVLRFGLQYPLADPSVVRIITFILIPFPYVLGRCRHFRIFLSVVGGVLGLSARIEVIC